MKLPTIFFWTIVVLLISCNGGFVHAQNTANYRFLDAELEVLQILREAWNSSALDPEEAEHSALSGWNASQRNPCYQNTLGEVHNWKGVQCLQMCPNVTGGNVTCDVHIIGLKLEDVEISGSLPPEIGKLSQLATLTLSGNPDLSGLLPKELSNTQLDYLDLHGNGFNGTVPVFDAPGLWTLLYLDLSGNNLTGAYPLEQIKSMVSLQSLNLAENAFEGELPKDAFENMTQLESVILSKNRFVGPLPNMTRTHHLQSLDLSGNKFGGPLPDYTMLDDLKHVNLSNNQLTGKVDLVSIFNSSVAKDMLVLDLSWNQLTGALPLWTSTELGSLESLYLDNNNITGTLNITYLTEMGLLSGLSKISTGQESKLKYVSLANNHIVDVVSEEWNIESTSTVFHLEGNPYCEEINAEDDVKRCYCRQVCFSTEDTSRNNRKTLIIATTATAGVLLALLILVVSIIMHRSNRYKRYLLLQVQQKFAEFDIKPTIFSYNELRAATRDFHLDNKLGEGGYGAVYKGVLPNGNTVAVKQLFMKSTQGIDEFLNEIVLITGMKHRNLVSLKGCCLREHQRLLVYEYVENNDLDVVLLHEGPTKPVLSWPVRLNICLGVARGLHYLHSLAQPRIIHRDIKASNILLDKNFEPKIADFGLALLFPDEQSHIMTIHIAGTKGYLAPEYASLGQLSEKVDVFSFGVLCLEIISGRRNINVDLPLDEVYLPQWAWQLHEADNVLELVDPSLHLKDEDKADVERLINVALSCLQGSVDRRPTMTRVVALLQEDTKSEVVLLAKGGSNSSERSNERLRLLDAAGTKSLPPVAEDRPLSFKDKKGSRSSSCKEKASSSSTHGDNTGTTLLELTELTGR